MSRTLCMGNQVLALGALKAGVNVVSGYPGTPSSEVLEFLSTQVVSRKLENLHVEWSTNEKAALEVGAGAAFAGARALVTMKQVGLNVASDALMTLPYLGVNGGLVLVVADDPGPISSQTEQDTRQIAAFAKVPLFDPTTPEEAFEMIQGAFELSERHKTPVIVRPTTRICHGTAGIDTDFDYLPHAIGGFDRSPRWVIFPKRAYEGHLEIIERLSQVATEFSESGYNSLLDTQPSATSRSGIVASGISYAYLHDALARPAKLGPLRLLKLGTPFPFPDRLARDFLDGLSEVLVLEELEPVIERELLRIAGERHLPVKIYGKLTGHTTTAGENSVDLIAEKIAVFCELPPLPAAALDVTPALPARPPVLCAGCPHRASFFAVKKALRGRKAVFGGDIGCYTLGNALPLDMVDTCVCMGAGFTVPQGMHWAQPDVLHLGFVGDSTFFASGMTGVTNAVYNQAKVTLCVLDNSTTAMTGSQPHPGTGMRMSSDATQKDAQNALRIPAVLSALGVQHIAQVDPFDLERAVEAVREAVDYEGVSALIFKAPCITVTPPQAQPFVKAELCTNCKSCIKSIGCPALVLREDKVAVDTTLCYGCKLCIQVCSFDAIEVPPAGDAA